MTESKTRQNIVIVGGGFAGLAVFNALQAKLDFSRHNLVLVNSRPYFLHLPGGIRMVTTSEDNLEERVLMSFDHKFNGDTKKLIVGTIASIVDEDESGGHLLLSSGEKVDYSILVLATGSAWEGALKFPDNKAQHAEWLQTWRQKFEKANDIVLVGGGAVGVEFSGELKDRWPGKNVTLVHGQNLLMNPTYPNRWREDVTRRTRERGTTLILEDFVDDMEISQDGVITTRNKQTITADLVVPTRGPRGPNTGFIAASLGPDVLSSSGYVKVLPTLQLAKHPRIFAGGDIIDWKEQKQAGKAPNHGEVIAGNVLALAAGQVPKKQYKGLVESILVTLGKTHGSGYFAILWGVILGNWLSTLIKSKGLLIDMMKSSYGLQ